MKKLMRRRETPITEIIKVALRRGITVEEAIEKYFLTPDLTPGERIREKLVRICRRAQCP